MRLRAASTIDTLGHVYTSLMSAWITETDTEKDVSYISSNWVKGFRARLISVASRVLAGKDQVTLASWEGGIRGSWPKEEYIRLTEVQEEMIAVLSQVCGLQQVQAIYDRLRPRLQLGGALWKLDTKWRLSLLHHTRVVDPNFVR